MEATFSIGDKKYSADLGQGICIGIPLIPNGMNPNCFFAPPPSMTPVKSEDWVGSIKKGSAVNFFNVSFNPHGNGTHTECIAHIVDSTLTVPDLFISKTHFSAMLISVLPQKLDNGDLVIGQNHTLLLEDLPPTDALIIRTLPNLLDKKTKLYSGNNPPYLDVSFMRVIREKGYQHLLLDLPSVDRESDGGKLACHKLFWEAESSSVSFYSITEMIFVENDVSDGIYLLDFGISGLKMDATPSRPMIYKAEECST